MKHFKFLSVLLIAILLLAAVSVPASADNTFADKTTFKFEVSSVDASDKPGNVLVRVLCTTDEKQLITTFGTTLVVNTDYFDLVSKSGAVITDNYKKEASNLGANFAFSASKIGAKKESFGGMKGLSIASYNSATKNMYIFMCGMTISGIRLKGETEVATFYLKSKADKVPASAIRTMDNSEGEGKACPSKAVYCGEISSTTEGGAVVNDNRLEVDSSLIDKSAPEEPTTEKSAETTKATTAPSTSSASAETTAGSTSAAAASSESAQPKAALTDEAIDKMSEKELEANIKKMVEDDKNLNLSDKVKASKAYKTYEKALENAEKALSDKNATKAQKAEALKQLVKAKTELEKEFPEVASSESSSAASKGKTGVWVYVAIAVLIAAIVIVLIIIIKKRKLN